MKKVLKITCVLLTVIMIFYSVPHLPVIAEDAGSANSALLYDKAFMGVGERCNFDWLINIDSYYFTVTNTSVADYDETNRSYIIGKAPGTTNVTLTYIEGGVIKYASFQLEVMEQAELPSGTYSIRSKVDGFQYAVCANNTAGNLRLLDFETSEYNQMKWTISAYNNDTYTIMSPAENAYIGVQQNHISENAVISFFHYSLYVIPFWRILINEQGDYLLVPYSTEGTNLVLVIPEAPASLTSPLILANYYEYSNYNEPVNRHRFYKSWYVYNDALTINNYYDLSFTYNTILTNLIPVATEFTIDAYQDALSFPIRTDNTVTQFISSASQCPTGSSSPCSTGICGTNCIDHHKNKYNLHNQTCAIPHKNNYVSVLWMDRLNSVYCADDHSLGGDAIGQATRGITMYTVTSLTNYVTPEPIETLMGMLLTHEIAHIYGLEDQYSEDPYAYDPHCKNEHGEKVYNCCMERTYYDDDRQTFYNRVQIGLEDIFCPSCIDLMTEYRHIYFENNHS